MGIKSLSHDSVLTAYSSQPPLELLRQVIDKRGFYDRKKLFYKEVQDTQFVVACAPPGGGRNNVTPRLLRFFNMFNVANLSQDSMKKIFSSILCGFLSNQGFAPEITALGSSIVDGRY